MTNKLIDILKGSNIHEKVYPYVAIVLIFCFAVTGCGKKTNMEDQAATEPVTEIPGAKEFP